VFVPQLCSRNISCAQSSASCVVVRAVTRGWKFYSEKEVAHGFIVDTALLKSGRFVTWSFIDMVFSSRFVPWEVLK